MQYQLNQSQKLESIGQLAAGIAHEINTPSQFVGDNLRFLKDGFSDMVKAQDSFIKCIQNVNEGQSAEDSFKEIDQIIEGADVEYLRDEIPRAIDQSLDGMARISKIVGAMRCFSHPDGEEKSMENINTAIETTMTGCRNEWKYVAEIELNLDVDLPMVPCYLGEFNQVVLNIIVNAAHAISDQLAISKSDKGLIKIATISENDAAVIEISDSGCGIPGEHLSKIFDPFYTTKEVGRGTGQGLYIAHSVIVEKHGGKLTVNSKLGEGTTFRITLPGGAASPKNDNVHQK